MNEIAVMNLGVNLTIAQASDLHEKFLKIFHDPHEVIFDASEVERADTAGMQCLYAFKKSVEAENVKIEWEDPSDALINAARLLGMVEYLELPEKSA